MLAVQNYYVPTAIAGALRNDVHLTSVAYIGPKLRTARPRKTKIGTEVAHVTRDSDTTFKVKRSRSTCGGQRHIVAASRTACCIQKRIQIDCLTELLHLPY